MGTRVKANTFEVTDGGTKYRLIDRGKRGAFDPQDMVIVRQSRGG